jgi:hypothetical protein
MRTLTTCQFADETATNGIDLAGQSVAYKTRNLASWLYLNPYNTVEASAGVNAVKSLQEDVDDEPNWARTALRSEAWAFWAEAEEDLYAPEDGQAL